jgi:hypothetical protein
VVSRSVGRLARVLNTYHNTLISFEFSNTELINSVSSRPLTYCIPKTVADYSTHTYTRICVCVCNSIKSASGVYIVFHCYPARRNYQKLVGSPSSLNHTDTHAHVYAAHHPHTLYTRIGTHAHTGQTIGSGDGGGGDRGIRLVSVFMENLSGRRRGVNEFRWSIIDRRDNEFKVAVGRRCGRRVSREYPVLSIHPRPCKVIEEELQETASVEAGRSSADCDDVTRNLT